MQPWPIRKRYGKRIELERWRWIYTKGLLDLVRTIHIILGRWRKKDESRHCINGTLHWKDLYHIWIWKHLRVFMFCVFSQNVCVWKTDRSIFGFRRNQSDQVQLRNRCGPQRTIIWFMILVSDNRGLLIARCI